MNAEATPKSKRPVFADDIEVSTTGEVKMIRPSHIRADHNNNESRGWAPYAAPDEIKHLLVDGRCCFTLDEIEQRFNSLMLEGQICEVEVCLGGDKRPTLTVGYLRHAAFLLAEVRGVLDQIYTTSRTKVFGVRAKIVPAPKSQDDWDRASDRNFAENSERLELTSVQFAFYLQRKLNTLSNDGTPLYTRKTLAQKLSASGRPISLSSVNQHLQLLSARPEMLLAVHEGRLKMAAALSQMRDKGEGTLRGKRASVPYSAIVRAVEHVDKRPPPSVGLTPKEMVLLARLQCGIDQLSPTTPERVKDWFVWASMPVEEAQALAPVKTPREPKASRRLSPPKPGETVQVDA